MAKPRRGRPASPSDSRSGSSSASRSSSGSDSRSRSRSKSYSSSSSSPSSSPAPRSRSPPPSRRRYFLCQMSIDPSSPDQRTTVEVTGHKAHGPIPQPGTVVIARVTKVIAKMASVDILCVGPKAVREKFTGSIRQQDVRATEIDKVDMHLSFRPGDIGRNEACDNFSGADLAELVRTATGLAVVDLRKARELGITLSGVIETSHFEIALKKIFPSVSAKQTRDYKVVSQRYKLI